MTATKPTASVHKATLHHLPVLRVIFSFVTIGLCIAALWNGDYLMLCVMAIACSLIVWRFKQMNLTFTKNSLIHRGWFSRRKIDFSGIVRVTRPHNRGYPYDRFFSDSIYEIRSSDARVRVNLLWFGAVASREFQDRVGKTRTRSRA